MAPQGQYKGAGVPFILGILLLTSPSWSSETGVVTESPYIDMTAGYKMHFSGVCRGSGSDYGIGMGHRWQRMSVGASIFWGEIEDCEAYWESSHGGGSTEWGSKNDVFGVLASGRFFIFSDEFWSQPYLGIDAGIGAFPSRGFLVRGGVGAEVRLYSRFSLDFKACYSLSAFKEEFPSPHYSTIHDFLVAAGLRTYF